ncbi:PP2C family protein-serine/threonine phosphatase [Treponema pedis]|uniref:PP2C family protein-serine/threonine phosphatase n=1 Tax=Treponema pedis TaxID=409322 RepID=UPI000408E698|nr:SpoIIE family protein phosphatase [Treponema pedis]QSI04068.1 sigma factor SigB regulation protein [Treponema pedis]
MIKLRKLLSNILISIGMSGVFALFLIFVSPRFLFLGKFYSASDMTLALSRLSKIPEMTQTHRFFIGLAVFILICIFAGTVMQVFSKKIENKEYGKPKTKIFAEFLRKLRFCYTTENLIDSIYSELEYSGDCSVMMIDAKEHIVIYNSASRFVSTPETFKTFQAVSENLKIGIHFFNADIKECKQKQARIAAVILESFHFFIVCRYLNEVEPEIFNTMLSEFLSYESRTTTLGKLLHLSELTHEWNMVAETQKAFLPRKIPEAPHLDIASYFRPLVNVSGDYYDVIKIDGYKTLLVLGDVSGKGLAAALVMGVVINTIKITKNKEDLAGLITAVDTAIKRMKLMDKYTVLFLGLIDTEKMTLKYVNASMENPMILTESPNGYKIKPLESTCSIVGIIDLDNIGVEERRLYRGDVIFMATDGIPETMNEEGIELGDTELYLDSIKSFAPHSARNILEDVANLAMTHVGKNKLRDDITMLCVKVKV